MSVLDQIGRMFDSSLGSLVYHLVILLAVEAALGMAWVEWHHSRHEQAWRYLQATIGLTLTRLAYALLAVLALNRWLLPPEVLPPLERVADAASICLLGWAFISVGRRDARAWTAVFGSGLLLALLCGILSAVHWDRALLAGAPPDYNQYWQSIAWAAGHLLLIVLAAAASVRSQQAGSSALLMAAGVLMLGAVGQIVSPVAGGLPTWQRVSTLVAYPLVVVAMYQAISTGSRAHTEHLEEIGQASLDQIKSLLLLFETSHQISSSLTLATVLDNAVQGVARVLDADQCAIAFPDGCDPGYMRLVAIYGPARQGRGEPTTFPLEHQLTVQQALRRKKCLIVEESENLQLKVLFQLLGSSEVGPLLVQPLLIEGEAIGIILVGNSRSRRPFTAHEAKLCQSLAEHAASAILNAREYQAAQERIRELHRSLEDKRHPLPAALPARGRPEPLVGIKPEVDASSSPATSLWRTG